MTKPIIFTLLGAALLASCGPEVENMSVDKPAIDKPSGEIFAPAENAVGVGAQTLTAAYDAENDQISITDGVSTIVVPKSTFGTSPAFEEYYGSDTYIAYGETSSGAGYASSIISETARALGGVVGGAFGRLSETEMPNSGSATYTGAYEGWLGDGSDFEAYALVLGDVEMTANFDNNDISGTISNREVYSEDETLDDVTLNLASIESGGFTGTTTGGDLTGSAGAPSQGDYSGMFVGADGQEIVGGLMIDHDGDVEAGAFILD